MANAGHAGANARVGLIEGPLKREAGGWESTCHEKLTLSLLLLERTSKRLLLGVEKRSSGAAEQ